MLQDNNQNLLNQIREMQVKQILDITTLKCNIDNNNYDQEFLKKQNMIIEINQILIDLFKQNDDQINKLLNIMKLA